MGERRSSGGCGSMIRLLLTPIAHCWTGTAAALTCMGRRLAASFAVGATRAARYSALLAPCPAPSSHPHRPHANSQSALVALVLFLATVYASAGALPRRAGQVEAEIAKTGAKAFLAGLDEDELDDLYRRIGSGSPEWVALSPMLAAGADGANAEGLTIALAFALPKNPEDVLAVASVDKGMLSIKEICSIPFIEDTVVNRAAYRKAALHKVTAVTKSSLQSVKSSCEATLKASK